MSDTWNIHRAAAGIGTKTVSAGHKVFFVNAKDLVDQLHEKMLDELRKISLLIVDELSYVKIDRERARLFFQVNR